MVHNIVAAILIHKDRILLGKRSPNREFYPNVWDVFGGHIEPEEQPEQTLIRELQEELDITPTQWVDLETVYDSISASADMSTHELVVYFYCVTKWTGEAVNRQLEEHSSIQWFSYEDAMQLDLAHPAYPRLFLQCLQMITGNEQ